MGLVLLWFLWRFGKNWEGGAMFKGRDKETCTVSFTEMGASLQRRQRGDLEHGLENLVGGDKPGVLHLRRDTQQQTGL